MQNEGLITAFAIMTGITVITIFLWLGSEKKRGKAEQEYIKLRNRLREIEKYEPKRSKSGRFVKKVKDV